MGLINPIVQKWLDEAQEDPETFWGRAAEQLPWFRKWDEVLEWNRPTFKWFVGGQTNMAYNALDHHVNRGWGGHTALVYLNERGERALYTYASLLHEVERVAAALRGMGIKKGDRLTIYMPTCPEAVILMLATVRIGALHSVVFAGFGAKALADRIQASGSRLVFTADITYRKGKDTNLKGIVDDAMEQAGSSVERVVVLRRGKTAPPMRAGRDIYWQEFLVHAAGQSGSLCAGRVERSGVHSGDLGYDREAQASGSHPWRLSGSHPQYGQVVVCPEAHRRVVVHLRYRLDRGTQLYRLCPAAGRRDHDCI